MYKSTAYSFGIDLYNADSVLFIIIFLFVSFWALCFLYLILAFSFSTGFRFDLILIQITYTAHNRRMPEMLYSTHALKINVLLLNGCFKYSAFDFFFHSLFYHLAIIFTLNLSLPLHILWVFIRSLLLTVGVYSVFYFYSTEIVFESE